VDFVLSSLEMMRGGEIFVPKIASMKMTEVAQALGPGLAQRTVGIRPGEKLHEVMISGDDAHMTTELADRYVIEPAFVEYVRRPFHTDLGRPVADGFVYSSETNPERLDAAGLMALLDSHG
jgi:UDP-N-acetylglucosamine 4,6-dehydratase